MDMQHTVAFGAAEQTQHLYYSLKWMALGGEYIRFYILLLIEVGIQQIHLGIDATDAALVVGYEEEFHFLGDWLLVIGYWRWVIGSLRF